MTKLHHYSLGQGPSIVLVHGWAMHSGLWHNFAAQLAQHYRVTCIDLPGHGKSPACKPFDLNTLSQLLANTVTEPNSCWLGWSLGATAVLALAERFPERVNRLILLAGNPRFVQSDDNWPGMAVSVFNAFTKNLSHTPSATINQFLNLQVYGLTDAKAQYRQLKSLFAQHPAPSLEILQSGLEILQYSDMRTNLANLNKPLLVVLGQYDNLVPVSIDKFIMDIYPNANVHLIEQAGHAFFLSHPTTLLHCIDSFMAEQ